MGGLFIQTLSTDPRFFFATIITVVLSITLHELAHGVIAIWCGDDTPRATGHMTLNPLVHMGGMSLLMLAIGGIAWGMMPVDPSRLRGKYSESLVALAGPVTNILLALLALVGLGLWIRFSPSAVYSSNKTIENAVYLLLIFGSTNILLAIFNLIPVPPLDGSRVVANFVPAYRSLLSNPGTQGIMVAVFFALFMGGGIYIQHWAMRLTWMILGTVAGHDYTSVSD